MTALAQMRGTRPNPGVRLHRTALISDSRLPGGIPRLQRPRRSRGSRCNSDGTRCWTTPSERLGSLLWRRAAGLVVNAPDRVRGHEYPLATRHLGAAQPGKLLDEWVHQLLSAQT